MRIAYLSSACIPSRTANSIHVMKMCQALASAGHEVVLFAPDKGNGCEAGQADPFGYYGVERVFNIKYLPWGGGVGAGVWYRLNSAWQVKRLGFDLAFGRGLAACCFAPWLGVPTIYETHSPIEDDGVVGRILFSLLIRAPSFKYLVVITDALRCHFEETWPTLRGRVVVAPDGADALSNGVEPFKLDSTGSRMQVGYTGHLYPGKGAELVVDLARVCPQFDFHIVGGTSNDLSRGRARDDLPDNLKLHGHQPHKDIPSYLIAFDVVLLPNQPVVRLETGNSDIGRWTSPLKLFEYMAAGRAIVCSDAPVLQEVAENGVNMLVCRHDEVSDWAAALQCLWADPGLRRSLGNTAREQLERLYSWDVRAKYLLDLGCFGRND
jgi:glycosyltransferase involved in cell wall biosynthesis